METIELRARSQELEPVKRTISTNMPIYTYMTILRGVLSIDGDIYNQTKLTLCLVKGKYGKNTSTPQLFFITNQIMYFHLENSISWNTPSYFMARTPQITLPCDLCFFCLCLIFTHFF